MAYHDINYKTHQYWRIQQDLSVKIDYLNAIWKYFDWEKVNLQKWIDQNINGDVDVNTKQEIERISYNTNLLFPHNFLSTNFSQLYTIMERSLGFICYDLKNRKEIELNEKEEDKIKRTKDNFLYIKTLLKKIDLSISDFDPQYNEIRNFQKFRNSIAHEGDRIVLTDPYDDAFRSFLERMDGIVIQDRMWVQEGGLSTYLMITDYPTKRFHTVTLEFFAKLLERLYPTDENKLWVD